MKQKRKIVQTFDPAGNKNGWLMELQKSGNKTAVYMTVIAPGCFKGYHVHKERTSNYVVLKGNPEIEMYKKDGSLEVVFLERGDAYSIGTNIAIGLLNNGNEEVWMINFPEPYYDPDLKNEQEDYTKETLKNWIGE